ncbi:MAG: helix-turn-helix transcriptional regulator [Agathobacter sp.]|nr:helix-turn-helix transcriptional regulator [Agathobacter sp.]
MDFLASFLASFSKTPSLPNGMPPETLLGHIYEEEADIPCQSLLSIHAYGSHYMSAPFSYHFRSLNSYLLLYTKNGNGTLQTAENKFTLEEMSLFLLDCRQPFSLSLSGSFWNFEIYFCTGSLLSAFYLRPQGMYWSLSHSAEILRHLQMLENSNKNFLHRNPILDLKCFANLFSDLSLAAEQEMNAKKNLPSYLLYMKKCFDYSYANHYFLTYFETELDISKYRLCREFSTVFGVSPIQYLNQRRIEAAKELLCTTSMTVHEIGSSVGFDNTNHFINLFKRSTGKTPNAYRQEN